MFSLGAVLTYAATGEGPFGDGTAASLIYRVVNAAPNLSGVPDQLRPLIEPLPGQEPGYRPTAGELLASFGAAQRAPQWLPPAPPAAPPAGPGTPSGHAEAGYHADADPPDPHAAVDPRRRNAARPASRLDHPGLGARRPGGPSRPDGPGRPMGPLGTVPGPTSSRGNRGRAALIAGAALVLAAASAGIALAVTSHSGAASAAPAPQQSVPQGTASPALATTGPAPASTSPVAATSQAAKAAPSVVGVWTGTYTCNQGLSGVRLTITGAGGDTVRATAEFYAVPSNPGVPDGSYVLTGNYSASGGLVLIPDYWINQPAGYEMVGLSGPRRTGTRCTARSRA